jgi:hypothetical protein
MKASDEIETFRQRTEGPNLGRANLVGLAQPARNIEGRYRDVQMKGCPGAGKWHPLSHRFEVVDRLARLDLDDASKFFAIREDEIGEKRVRAELDRRHLLIADVRGHLKFFLVLCLKESNEAIVLELLSDWSDENRRHTASQPLGRLPETTQVATWQRDKGSLS